MKIKNIFIRATFLILITTANVIFAADQNWRIEFDRICAHTSDAGQLSKEELAGLIEECDKLLEVIKADDEPDKKVYLIRLKKCRNFFDFMRTVPKKTAD